MRERGKWWMLRKGGPLTEEGLLGKNEKSEKTKKGRPVDRSPHEEISEFRIPQLACNRLGAAAARFDLAHGQRNRVEPPLNYLLRAAPGEGAPPKPGCPSLAPLAGWSSFVSDLSFSWL